MPSTVKPLNSGHLRLLKSLPVIKRCPLLGGSLTNIVIFGTIHFVRYLRHVRYSRCPLLTYFPVFQKNVKSRVFSGFYVCSLTSASVNTYAYVGY